MRVYKVFLTKKSKKNLAHLASYDAKNIIHRLQQLDVPFPNNLDIKKMSGTPGFYRLRSGSVRAIFEILEKQKEIWVRKIDYRGNIY
ncbi:MAG: Plasmid stabilization system [Candidatus Gottesmanbacteria bacterium GW2011_GWA1_47_8]|uniref:Plasmid stabilization system n=1 Tax=Candidatus Gottesmanbacteria bacterium GW2011_GWA1_47_8 TaxID=1618438 RepID=A0A0G1VRI4_9BACT|nr:MAG: Plasmid stabilization system [Candidatus Gottesmanbacteria bacterium GW2011_GWA1_47_8]